MCGLLNQESATSLGDQPDEPPTVTALRINAFSSPVYWPSLVGPYLSCYSEPRGSSDTGPRGTHDTDPRGPRDTHILSQDYKQDIHVHLRPVFGPPTPPGFVRVQLRHQRCQHCASRNHPRRYLGKPAGATVHFRATLAHLLETRLNPRASPFVFPASVRRNRWQYVTDPVTQHLRLPAPYKICALQRTRSASKSTRRSLKSVQKIAPTNTRLRKSHSGSQALSPKPLAAQITELRAPHKSSIASSCQKTRDKSPRIPRSALDRHCLHRRHRKNSLRGLPTPASSLYPRQRSARC